MKTITDPQPHFDHDRKQIILKLSIISVSLGNYIDNCFRDIYPKGSVFFFSHTQTRSHMYKHKQSQQKTGVVCELVPRFGDSASCCSACPACVMCV